jgi:hypothetical protein
LAREQAPIDQRQEGPVGWYQDEINAALRAHMDAHRDEEQRARTGNTHHEHWRQR